MSAMVSHPTQIEGIKQQEPLNLVPGTPMEVELISLDTPRLADAVLPVSTPQNELEGIRFEPDPLWDEEGEAYAGWTQVDNRFPPMSKIEVDERMEDGEDLEEDYEQLQVSYGCGCCSINRFGLIIREVSLAGWCAVQPRLTAHTRRGKRRFTVTWFSARLENVRAGRGPA
jgi:hypothetical protein